LFVVTNATPAPIFIGAFNMPYQGGSHDEENEKPSCDEKTNTPGETNQQDTQMLPTNQRLMRTDITKHLNEKIK
jgi:hypothetical protein